MTAPKPVPVVPGLFTETPAGPRLLGSKCVTCGTPYFPASAVCHNPDCTEPRVIEAAFGPRGTLWSYAVQHYPPPPPAKYDEPYVPYAIGLVDLPEGLRILARLSTGDLAGLTVGLEVELAVDKLYRDRDGNQVVTWAFTPR